MLKATEGSELSITLKDNAAELETLFKALGSEIRIKILRQLYRHPMTVRELSQTFRVPISTMNFHVAMLEQANLIIVNLIPSKKGAIRACYGNFSFIHFEMDVQKVFPELHTHSEMIPIGNYIDFKSEGEHGCASPLRSWRNNESDFLSNRSDIGIIWTTSGYVEYGIGNYLFKRYSVTEMTISFEICSEINSYRNDWQSMLNFYINGTRVASYLSPGDFGGRRGTLNPDWWPDSNTQYGLLKSLTVNSTGIYLDRNLVTKEYNINNLGLDKSNKIVFRIETDDKEHYNGGFNLFGKTFGDFPQDISVDYTYRHNN